MAISGDVTSLVPGAALRAATLNQLFNYMYNCTANPMTLQLIVPLYGPPSWYKTRADD